MLGKHIKKKKTWPQNKNNNTWLRLKQCSSFNVCYLHTKVQGIINWARKRIWQDKKRHKPNSSYPKLSIYKKRESALRQKCVCEFWLQLLLQHTDSWGSAITNKTHSLPTAYQTLVVSNITTGFAHDSAAKWQQGFCLTACFTFSLWNNCLSSNLKLSINKHVLLHAYIQWSHEVFQSLVFTSRAFNHTTVY